jgi:hypothetical protein
VVRQAAEEKITGERGEGYGEINAHLRAYSKLHLSGSVVRWSPSFRGFDSSDAAMCVSLRRFFSTTKFLDIEPGTL